MIKNNISYDKTEFNEKIKTLYKGSDLTNVTFKSKYSVGDLVRINFSAEDQMYSWARPKSIGETYMKIDKIKTSVFIVNEVEMYVNAKGECDARYFLWTYRNLDEKDNEKHYPHIGEWMRGVSESIIVPYDESDVHPICTEAVVPYSIGTVVWTASNGVIHNKCFMNKRERIYLYVYHVEGNIHVDGEMHQRANYVGYKCEAYSTKTGWESHVWVHSFIATRYSERPSRVTGQYTRTDVKACYSEDEFARSIHENKVYSLYLPSFRTFQSDKDLCEIVINLLGYKNVDEFAKMVEEHEAKLAKLNEVKVPKKPRKKKEPAAKAKATEVLQTLSEEEKKELLKLLTAK